MGAENDKPDKTAEAVKLLDPLITCGSDTTLSNPANNDDIDQNCGVFRPLGVDVLLHNIISVLGRQFLRRSDIDLWSLGTRYWDTGHAHECLIIHGLKDAHNVCNHDHNNSTNGTATAKSNSRVSLASL